MIKFYKYLYILPYRWFLKNEGADDFPQFSALFIVTFILFITLADFALLISAVFNLHWLSKPPPKIITIAFVGLLMGINYTILLYKSKYRKINAEFELISSSQKRRWFWMAILYTFISLTAGVFLAILSG